MEDYFSISESDLRVLRNKEVSLLRALTERQKKNSTRPKHSNEPESPKHANCVLCAGDIVVTIPNVPAPDLCADCTELRELQNAIFERDDPSTLAQELLKKVLSGETCSQPMRSGSILSPEPQQKPSTREGSPHHKNMPLVLAALSAQVPVWMHGDAGSGKSTAASQAAEKLGLPFRFISLCPTTTKSELFGYKDAHGTYHPTAFREVFEHGGIFLFDEMDNGNPSILAVLNAALANNCCAFPDGNITRHKDARFIAAANTIGRGADTRYIGRTALDATTLDRFVFVRIDIDENLEKTLVTGEPWKKDAVVNIAEGGPIDVKQWHDFVLKVRNACQMFKIEHVVSPRAGIYGRRLIALGVGKTHLETMCLWKGLRETDRRKIEQYLNSPT